MSQFHYAGLQTLPVLGPALMPKGSRGSHVLSQLVAMLEFSVTNQLGERPPGNV